VLYRFFDPLWKAKKLLNISSEAAMKRSVRTINDFVYAVIDRKVEQMGRDQHEFVSFFLPHCIAGLACNHIGTGQYD
jgi:hypothetical protein